MSNITNTREADGTVALITMDDGKANALSKEMIADLRAAIDEAAADENVVAAVVAGREGKFSAGFDLNVMNSGDMGAVVDLVADGGDLVRHAFGCDLPIVAACTGHALAAGALLLLGCDIRIGADGPSKIGVNEVAIGMVLPDWAMTICRERLNPLFLQPAVANARITDPAGAVEVGFLDSVVPPEKVVEAAVEAAASLAPLHRGAYRGTMKSFRGGVLDQMSAEVAADRASGTGVSR